MSRLPAVRLARIGAWTALATGWTSAAIATVASASTAAEPTSVATPEQPWIVQVGETGGDSLPALPQQGIVVIRHTPAPQQAQEPVVVQRVVVQQAPAPAAPAPVVTSRGS